MGKLVAISGADFTNCGLGTVTAGNPSTTTWYSDYGSTFSSMTETANLSVAPFAYPAISYATMFMGKPINLFRINVLTAGTFTVSKVTNYGSTNNMTTLQVFTIASTGLQNIQLTTPITLAANEALAFNLKTDTCVIGYYDAEIGLTFPDTAVRGFRYSLSTNFDSESSAGSTVGLNIGYTSV